ncbi:MULTISPECIES: glycosyltransferase [unclassified Rhizobacter]|uniref:glycosyltransferase n=1 Tax=unclassified Rhizobacter TaxID=2640088 RepID=UPI000701DF1D|nr:MULTISPECIES: glycosyltransferase [unclassified Rhizobacter]KQU65968.1 glycosyl transferase [Rhizobacter sp. Root29]KQV97891.1 glycosyl transferase [Rhizobacter sp. Root1238]KRB18722.1 glycosyl transferase [Rhizobacter sp. Root16D2]
MHHLIVFSHLRWNFVHQRPQHLLSRLAKQFHVVFIEEPLHEAGTPRLTVRQAGPNIDVVVPHTPIDATGFHDDQLPLLKPLLADHLARHRITEDVVWFYTPMALPLLSDLKPRVVVYDCMDELTAFKDAPRQLRQRETALLRQARLVLTGGPRLYDAKRALHPNVHCLPSSVDAAHFSPRHLPRAAAGLERADPQRPRLGFFGVIDERFDHAMLAALADARPDWQFVMAGPVVKIDPAALPRAANIQWLGMQPYERLPLLMAGWDVCLMPFAMNESTRFISPTKTLEYMAGEKPVVSTPVHDVVALYGDLVRIAATPDEFLTACEAALAETPAQRAARIDAMRQRVAQTSWDRSAAKVLQLLSTELAAREAGAEPVRVPAVHRLPAGRRAA